jgi:tRNA1(Val) A37 N6-methylase TrmN6
MVTRDLLGTNLLITSEQGKAFNLDTILLADFVRIPKGSELVCDFGTGNGSILLYLSQKFHKKLIGVEIQKHRYEQAIENINMNELDKQIHVLNQDIKATKLKKEADVIVSNPPFFKVN